MKNGYKFSYKHSHGKHTVSVRMNEDSDAHEVVETLVDFLIASGFTKGSVARAVNEYGFDTKNEQQ